MSVGQYCTMQMDTEVLNVLSPFPILSWHRSFNMMKKPNEREVVVLRSRG